MVPRSRRPEGAHSAALRHVLLAILVAAALFNMWLASVVLGRVDEARYGESLIYGHAARVLDGQPLYQRFDQPPYTIANYTPLYYWLVGVLRVAFGAGFWSGRLVSLVCGGVAAALVGWLAWRRTRAVWPAAAAGLSFVGLGLAGPLPWTAAYKEDLLGVALTLASVVVLEGARSRSGVIGAGLLAAGALLTKQSLVGPAVAGTLWLVVCCPRGAAWYVASVVLPVLGAAIALEATSGAFLASTIGGNTHQPFDRLTFEYNLAQLATFQSGPALLAAIAVLALGARVLGDLVALNWFGSMIPLLPLGAIGADNNYWLQFAALSAVLAVGTVWTRREQFVGALSVVLLGASVALGLIVVARPLVAHPEFVLPSAGDGETLARLVQRVAQAPTTVLADPLDVVVLAGRPIVLEPILFSLLEQDGAWDSSALVERVCRGEVGLVILGYPLAEAGQRYPSSVAAVMQRTLVLEESVPLAGRTRYVLVRDPRAECG
jgi:hypothetical protein